MIDDTYLVVCQSNYYITAGDDSHQRRSRMRVYDLKSIISQFNEQQRKQQRESNSNRQSSSAAAVDYLNYYYSGDGSDYLLVSDFELDGDRPFCHLVADKYQIYLLGSSPSPHTDDGLLPAAVRNILSYRNDWSNNSKRVLYCTSLMLLLLVFTFFFL